MGWIWAIVPVLAILSPFTYLIVRKWMDYRIQLAEAQTAPEVVRRLAAAEEALAISEHRLEKLEAVIVDQLLDVPTQPAALEAADRSTRASA